MSAKVVYALIVVFVTSIGLAVANVAYTNYVDQRRVNGERAAATARAAQSEQARLAFCTTARVQAEVFQASTTKVGQDAYAAWVELGRLFRCT